MTPTHISSIKALCLNPGLCKFEIFTQIITGNNLDILNKFETLWNGYNKNIVSCKRLCLKDVDI
jgi:hypothetical protein